MNSILSLILSSLLLCSFVQLSLSSPAPNNKHLTSDDEMFSDILRSEYGSLKNELSAIEMEKLRNLQSLINDVPFSDNFYDLYKRAPAWGKRAPAWGKRAPAWGK
ncbi:hypothetical protein SNEBB_002985 [Seison nebaliae]|nr:hypothetical protein SNEBB_002985 [Seison nebaliae]